MSSGIRHTGARELVTRIAVAVAVTSGPVAGLVLAAGPAPARSAFAVVLVAWATGWAVRANEYVQQHGRDWWRAWVLVWRFRATIGRSRRLWVRAADEGWVLPTVVGMRHVNAGIDFVVRLPAGLDVTAVDAVLTELAGSCGCADVIVTKEDGRRVGLRALYRDPLRRRAALHE